MIRSAEWKYIHRYPYGPHELYYLKKDPDENNNLIDEPQHRHVVAEYRSRLTEWFIKYADPGLDGSREGVFGSGQINLAGNRGKESYCGLRSALKKD